MPVHHATARKLATATEWTLIKSSFSRAITHTSLTPERLRKNIARAQELHDTYRELGVSVKQEMFADTVARYEARLSKITPTLGERLAAGGDTRPSRESNAVLPGADREDSDPTIAHEAAASTAERAHSKESRAARKALESAHQSTRTHQAHGGARTQRRQAGRDAR